MTMQLTLPQSEGAAPEQPPQPVTYSPSWWEGRSSDELRLVIDRGLQGGDLFDAAIREMQRRDAQAPVDEHAAVVGEIALRKKRARLAWIFAAVAIVLAGVAGLLINL